MIPTVQFCFLSLSPYVSLLPDLSFKSASSHFWEVAFTPAFEELLEQSLTTACVAKGEPEPRVVVLHSSKDTGEVDFTIQPAEKSAEVLGELEEQLRNASSELRSGSLAKFACYIQRLSTILPSAQSLWMHPEQGSADQLPITVEFLRDLEGTTTTPEDTDEAPQDPHDEVVDVRKRPEYWGVRVRELAQFHSSIHEERVDFQNEAKAKSQCG